MNHSIFKNQNWPNVKYDGRRKVFKGISRTSFREAQSKHWQRKALVYAPPMTKVQRFRRDMAFFASIPYVYQGDGLDDYNKYQRPCSNGVGYVAVCPGEPANNYYVDDPLTVKCLKRKYNEWLQSNSNK